MQKYNAFIFNLIRFNVAQVDKRFKFGYISKNKESTILLHVARTLNKRKM